MQFHRPVTELIQMRFSCRTYQDRPIEEETRRDLADFLASDQVGPLGTRARFLLVAAAEQDRAELRGLGTYGVIRGATGFVIGAVGRETKGMEDYGYMLERIVLLATDLGLGTCWLGGFFTRSSFSTKIGLGRGEVVPAVIATGYPAERRTFVEEMVRRQAGSAQRYAWGQLFFRERLGSPLAREEAGAYAVPLEMVRLAPSASNKQPWRVVQDGSALHFFLQRTPGYGSLLGLVRLADLQRVDMGIAMSHFELTAQELGLRGRWVSSDPGIPRPAGQTEYVVSWVEE